MCQAESHSLEDMWRGNFQQETHQACIILHQTDRHVWKSYMVHRAFCEFKNKIHLQTVSTVCQTRQRTNSKPAKEGSVACHLYVFVCIKGRWWLSLIVRSISPEDCRFKPSSDYPLLMCPWAKQVAQTAPSVACK